MVIYGADSDQIAAPRPKKKSGTATAPGASPSRSVKLNVQPTPPGNFMVWRLAEEAVHRRPDHECEYRQALFMGDEQSMKNDEQSPASRLQQHGGHQCRLIYLSTSPQQADRAVQ